ncbi:MAG TPA: CoA-binding protein [Gemmatimonadales bacterium]|nr:CoA-binding protein [Gemmatimonadales bacterium]
MSLPLPIDRLLQIYENTEAIAVVGASADPLKQANRVPRYLQTEGFRVIPVNPRGGVILGLPAVPSLLEVGRPVDVVQVFRPADEAPGIARDAVAAGAGVLWLQLGIVSAEAQRIAQAGGLTVVMDVCMGATHKLLRRRHGLAARVPEE